MTFFFTLYIMFVGPTGIGFVKVENAQFMNRATCRNVLPIARASMGTPTYIIGDIKYKGTLVCLPYKLGEKRTSVKGENSNG
ncbi:hypothetical protein N9878_00610 [bacterium]|nr:hypothetical protein [bacterium]